MVDDLLLFEQNANSLQGSHLLCVVEYDAIEMELRLCRETILKIAGQLFIVESRVFMHMEDDLIDLHRIIILFPQL